MPNEDTSLIEWETCKHQTCDDWDMPFNFCPWCGKDLREEQSNDQIQRIDGTSTEEQR